MNRLHKGLLFGTLILLWGTSLIAAPVQPSTSESEQANPPQENSSALDRRVAIEMETRFKPFVLSPHKPNYIMPYTHSAIPNQAPFDPVTDYVLDSEEIKFQVSIKFAMVDHLFGEGGSLYFAYTNLSFWQAYNSSASRPFRETNHEPEVFLAIPNDWQLWGFRNRANMIGLVHQSNGQGGNLSRSWNRVYADFIFEHGDFYFSIRPWLRVDGNSDDDNPDIERFLGHGELRAVYATGRHTASLMFRNNLHADNYGAVELNYSYPMSRRAKWFLQYFEGYGESLIDYNARIQRFGIGIAFTDWL